MKREGEVKREEEANAPVKKEQIEEEDSVPVGRRRKRRAVVDEEEEESPHAPLHPIEAEIRSECAKMQSSAPVERCAAPLFASPTPPPMWAAA